jgi:hypothetical protein
MRTRSNDPRLSNERLEAVVDAIGKRKGATLPTQQAYEDAQRIIANSGNRGSIGVRTGVAAIFYVTDGGKRHMVAVYEDRDTISAAECGCGSGDTCAHLLAVLATHHKPLGR